MRAILAILIIAAAPAFAAAEPANTKSDTYKMLNLFGEVFQKTRTDYVDEVTYKKLIENAINGMLSALDPHSGYMDEE